MCFVLQQSVQCMHFLHNPQQCIRMTITAMEGSVMVANHVQKIWCTWCIGLLSVAGVDKMGHHKAIVSSLAVSGTVQLLLHTEKTKVTFFLLIKWRFGRRSWNLCMLIFIIDYKYRPVLACNRHTWQLNVWNWQLPVLPTLTGASFLKGKACSEVWVHYIRVST